MSRYSYPGLPDIGIGRLSARDAVARLDAVEGKEPDGDHGYADEVLLRCVPQTVAEAYLRLTDRADWWATS